MGKDVVMIMIVLENKSKLSGQNNNPWQSFYNTNTRPETDLLVKKVDGGKKKKRRRKRRRKKRRRRRRRRKNKEEEEGEEQQQQPQCKIGVK